jgi:23S rRNA (cytosine1962-C5)-methyltransferase
MVTVFLKSGKEKFVRSGHPWIFSGAISRIEGNPNPGDPCAIIAASGEMLGHGYCNTNSSIVVRVLTLGEQAFTDAMLADRLKRAVALRAPILDATTNVCRLVNSEGDFLPGLIVDRYGEGLCVQILTAGMERLREIIINHLTSLCSPAFIFERSEGESRQREGLAARNGLLAGVLPNPHVVCEHGIKYGVDVGAGQKTGLFLDQRENRMLVRQFAGGASTLDCFAYAGGFSLNALAAGSRSVRTIDASKKAIELARENRRLNGFAAPPEDLVAADVFEFLRAAAPVYSLVILDPPKFAKREQDVDQASRGYKDINLLALRAVAPQGGILLTFSCSQAIDAKLFRQIVFGAAADSGRSCQVLQVLSQPMDHPVNLAHKEGEYLKGLILRVL